MSTNEADRLIRRRGLCVFGAILSAMFLCLASVVSGQSAIVTLEPGKPIKREIAGGEIHSYRVVLDSGQYLSAVIEQLGIDVIVRILGPDHQQLAEANNWKDTGRPELLSLMTNASGEYYLEVRAAEGDATAGRYEIKIKLLSVSTAEGKTRVAADRIVIEAETLRAQGTTESRRKALEKYKEALSLWVALGDQGEQSETIFGIGLLCDELGELRQGLEYYEQALTLARAVGDRRQEAHTLVSIGAHMRLLGDHQKALQCFAQALTLQQAAGDRRGEAYTLVNLGEFYYYVSDQQKAQDYFRRALQLMRALGDLQGEIEELVNLGMTYRALGEQQEALQYYNQALALIRPHGDPRVQAYMLNSVGSIYYDLGEQDKTLEFLSRALQIRLESGDASAAFTENAIGFVYQALGEARKALEYHERALLGMRALGDTQGEAATLTYIGKAYAQLGEPQKALEYFDQALPLLRAVSDRRSEALTLSGIGEVHQSLGQLPRALEYFYQALLLQQVIGDRIGAAATLYDAARAERELGQLEEARAHIETALESVESSRTKISSYELRTSYLASKQHYYEFYVDLLMRMNARDPVKTPADLGLLGNERARARGLLDVLAEARTDLRAGVDPGLIEREARLRRELNSKSERVTRLLSRNPDDAQAVAAKKELESLLTAYQEVEAQIRSSSPRYAALTQPVPLSLKEIQKQVLDENSLLLEYSLGDEKSYLWAVTPNSIESFELPKRATIEEAARRVYESLTARGQSLPNERPDQKQKRIDQADREYPRASLALSQILLGPVVSELGRKRLVVVSDGALQYVPFAALPDPPSQESRVPSLESKTSINQTRDSRLSTPDSRLPLIVDHEIVSLPSLSVLAALRDEVTGRQAAPKTLAVLADPVFGLDDPRMPGTRERRAMGGQEQSLPANILRSAEESGVTGFVRLRFSRSEADAIALLAPASQRLEAVDFVANRATATSVDLSHYRIVHFATHGLINSRHPELSGIVLSLVDEKGQPQNGFLRLYEIYNLKLNADLVVLSACQTALGKEIKGEGLIGLTRGFMYAGAPRVVASLWRIDDRATAVLMARFYRGMLKDGLPPAAALRAAQVSMWKEQRWTAPHYWAAFTIQGEWK